MSKVCFIIFFFVRNKFIFLRRIESNPGLDELILKYVCRYRTNGGFFRALKEPLNHREYLLKRLTGRILQDSNNAQKANLTPNDIDQ